MKIEITKVPTLYLRFDPGDFRRSTVYMPAQYCWLEDGQPRENTVVAGTRYNGVGPGNGPFVWLLEFVCPRWGRSTIAALPHDVAFETRFTAYPSVKAARKYADVLFREILLDTLPKIEKDKGVLRRISSTMDRGLCWLDAWVKYYAVRWLAEGVWDKRDREFQRGSA